VNTTTIGRRRLLRAGPFDLLRRAATLAIIAAAIVTRARAACPSFAIHNVPGSTSPVQAATGDFNGDGVTDFVTVGASGTVVFISTGNGNYLRTVLGGGSKAVAVGDVNNDGKLDIVSDGGVFMGHGDGTFTMHSNPYIGSARSITLADITATGHLDLALTGFGNPIVVLGDGSGFWGNNLTLGNISGATSVKVGDLNGDGRPDFVIGTNGGSIAVVFRNSDGTFSAPTTYLPGSLPMYVALADFNGDGKLDIATANYGSNNVAILLNNGSGGFTLHGTFATAAGPDFIDVGDVNNDGKLDLLVPGSNASAVTVLFGDSTGSFTAQTIASQPNAQSAVFADMNADDQLDIVTANFDTNDVSILTDVCKVGCGSYLTPFNQAVGTTPRALGTADFNGDGKADLVVANSGANSFSILTGNGAAGFSSTASVAIASGTGLAALVVKDFNNDGRWDLAFANATSNNVSVFLGVGNGTFTAGGAYAAGSAPSSVTAGDFNGDGKMDLAVANRNSNDVSILLGNGDGTFGAAINYAVGTAPASIVAADFDGDGKIDLAVANQGSNNVSILHGNGDGTFAAAVNVNAGTAPDFIAVSDFNGDNIRDLAVANFSSANVSILTGNGDGTFAAAVNFATGTQPTAIAIGDFDQDGNRDLAVANSGSNNVSVLYGTGTGSFGSAVNVTMGSGAASIVAMDANHHGRVDLVTANPTPNNITVAIDFCPISDLAITKSHTGSFRQGDVGRTFTVFVSNTNGPGIVATAGTVTVPENLPA